MKEEIYIKSDIKINDEDFPALFQAADRAAKTAQDWHFRLVRSDLFMLVMVPLLASFSIDRWKFRFSFATVICLLLSLIITIWIRTRRYDRSWIAGRVVAESLRKLAWLYMVCAEPYSRTLSIAEADEKFTSDLKKILEERKDLPLSLAGELSDRPQITERMREIRMTDTRTRRDLYNSNRIETQRQWYRKAAQKNKSQDMRRFTFVVLAQVLAFTSALIVLFQTKPWITPRGFFASLAAVLLAWMQLRQHQELAQSYSLAAQELGLISEKIKYIDTDAALSSLVTESETVISREETQWQIRRER
jgi:hypothetical protein